jgi:hypothetical protein
MPKTTSIHDVNIFIPMKSGGNANTLYISIISVFIIFSLIVYLKPDLFLSIFGSLLGNIVLFGLVLSLSFYHMKSGIAIGLFFFMLVLVVRRSNIQKITDLDLNFGVGVKKEGFTDSASTTAWSSTLVNEFLNLQKVLNPDITYDMSIVQKQATPDEVAYLLKNNKWPWSDKLQSLYKEAIAQNSFMRVDPGISMIDAQQIYNETAMKEMLSYNTKEGTFLLYGATVGHNKELPSNINNTIQCSTNKKGDSILEKIVYNGYDSIYGNLNSTVTEVDYNELPAQVNGFKFLGDPCNPCVALKNRPEYTCPFALNTGNGYDVSPIWQMLWNLTPESLTSSETSTSGTSSTSSGTSSSTSSSNFPILSQLKSEINQLDFISQIKTNTGVSSNTGATNNATSTGTTTSASNAFSLLDSK